MSKKVKDMELTTLRKALSATKDFVLLEPLKVDAATDYEFRRKLREKSIRVQMVKNSYAKKIFGESGLNAGEVWSGPTLLCYGGGSVKELSKSVETALKESKKDAKAPDKFKVKTGVADGNPTTLEDMTKMPTREEAIANVLAIALAPGANLLAALIGPGGTALALVKAVELKAGEAGDSSPAEAAPATDAPTVAS